VVQNPTLADAFWLVADAEPPAALGAARGDDCSATLGAHTCKETVLALARNTLGLVGPLYHVLQILL